MSMCRMRPPAATPWRSGLEPRDLSAFPKSLRIRPTPMPWRSYSLRQTAAAQKSALFSERHRSDASADL
jgi:hypothetical protein